MFNAFSLISTKSKYPKAILRKTSQSALDNVFKLSPARALSGPIDRGDIYTIRKHIEALDAKISESKSDRFKLLRAELYHSVTFTAGSCKSKVWEVE